jgi:hypothetical protein
MSSEPSYPKDASVGEPAELNDALKAAVSAKAAKERAASDKGGSRYLVRGAAIGIGSAALVAALLYANRSRKPDKPGGDVPAGPDADRQPLADS